MKKKFLSLMLSFTVAMSVTACGGSDTGSNSNSSASVSNSASTSVQEPAAQPEPSSEAAPVNESENADEVKMASSEANGLQISLPTGFVSADSGVEGLAAFTNADKTVFVTIAGPVFNDTATPDQLTEEVFASMFQDGGYDNVTVDNVGTVQQPDGATAVAAFATGSMNGEPLQNIVMQYYFMADGSGTYVINYMYPLDDTATDDVITEILASVTATDAGAQADTEDGFSLWNIGDPELIPDLSGTAWNICGGFIDGREMTEEELNTLLEAYSGTCQFVFDADGGAKLVQGSGELTGTYEYKGDGGVGVFIDANGTELRYGCIFTEMDGLVMIAISDEDGQNGLYFAQ